MDLMGNIRQHVFRKDYNISLEVPRKLADLISSDLQDIIKNASEKVGMFFKKSKDHELMLPGGHFKNYNTWDIKTRKIGGSLVLRGWKYDKDGNIDSFSGQKGKVKFYSPLVFGFLSLTPKRDCLSEIKDNRLRKAVSSIYTQILEFPRESYRIYDNAYDAACKRRGDSSSPKELERDIQDYLNERDNNIKLDNDFSEFFGKNE